MAILLCALSFLMLRVCLVPGFFFRDDHITDEKLRPEIKERIHSYVRRLIFSGGDTESYALCGPLPPVRDSAEDTGFLIQRDLF